MRRVTDRLSLFLLFIDCCFYHIVSLYGHLGPKMKSIWCVLKMAPLITCNCKVVCQLPIFVSLDCEDIFLFLLPLGIVWT